MSKFAAIPQPTHSIPSLVESVIALKEAVEVLARQRGDTDKSAVTWGDLKELNSPETGKRLIDPKTTPGKKGT